MLAAHAAESMSLLGVIMNRDEWICIEDGMNLRLRFRRTELIRAGDVQQQWTAQPGCLFERFFDTDTVVTNRTIRFEPHRQQVREIPAEAETDRARASTARRMLSQKLERRGRVFDRLRFVKLLVKLERLGSIVFR